MARMRHVPDDRLIDCYYAQRAGDTIDPPSADHLAECSECRARYADLCQLLDGARADGDAAVDLAFTTERLEQQARSIADRLSHVGQPARVITFPGRALTRRGPVHGSRATTRWIAAAAVAGLAIGLSLGVLRDSERHAVQSVGQMMARARTGGPGRRGELPPLAPTRSRAAAAADAPADPPRAQDEAFLSDLERALERPHTPVLQAFDAFTPHVREVKDVSSVR